MKKLVSGFGAAVALLASTQIFAEEALKPFILGITPPGNRAQVVEYVQGALEDNGFQVVGRYDPYPNATIVAVTNDEIKAIAAKTEFGGYGSALRVAVTEVDGEIQVAYTNPSYMASAYRMADNMAGIKANIETALGKHKEFGASVGLSEKQLRKYRYMIGMERFDTTDKHLLLRYATHREALKSVEKGLRVGRGGVTKVYRIDIPGKEEVVFGVAIGEGEGADKHVMDRIDSGELRSTPHLPYEILVSGNRVYHLFARFRIAMNFPDLSMSGNHSFTSIMHAPNAIQESLVLTANGR